MCARFTRRVDIWVYAKLFDFLIDVPTPVAFNIAPTNPVDTVRVEDGQRRYVPITWGFLPAWAKDVKTRYINARAETVHESKMFRSAFEKRRCLILADGIIEWQTVEKRKLPFLFTLKDDKPFAFAGIWNRTRIGAESVESCAILTTAANELFASIHDRMPVVLRPESVGAWLDSEVEDPSVLGQLLVPYVADEMSMRAISAKVNNVRNKSADCLEPATPAASGDLFADLL